MPCGGPIAEAVAWSARPDQRQDQSGLGSQEGRRNRLEARQSQNLSEAAALGRAANKQAADAFAANTLPIIRQMQTGGLTTYQALADALKNRGIRTARGGQWYAGTVMNILKRGP
jgi:hypothetical protein